MAAAPGTPVLQNPESPGALFPQGDGFEGEKTELRIDPNKDLWQNIAMNVKDATGEGSDQTVLVVGCRASGKTSLIYRMLSLTQQVKPTTALEYYYGKREERNVTHIAHFWELAQGKELAQLSDVVITPENVNSAVLVIVVDCANPNTAWDTVDFWLKRVDRRVQEIFQKMRAKGYSTPDKMIALVKKRIGTDHPDLAKLRIIGLPIVIVASRLDMFKQDGPKLKLIVRALRYMAHLYAASLIFTSDHEREATKFRALLSHLIFQVPLEQKHVQLDIERGGILIPTGLDSFKTIGERPVVSMSQFKPTGDAELDKWKAAFDDAYPPQKEAGTEADAQFFAQLYDVEKGAGEPLIDAMRKQKDEELDQYRRTIAKKAAEEKAAKKN